MPPQHIKPMTGNAAANGSGSANGLGNGSLAKVKQPMSPMRSASISVGGFRPPATPQPDYDAVQIRSSQGSESVSGRDVATSQQQRRTLRLGTVTIGEYGDQRTTGKRETLRKTNGEPASNGILKNGSNRSSASFNHGSSHQTEKTIKFGNWLGSFQNYFCAIRSMILRGNHLREYKNRTCSYFPYRPYPLPYTTIFFFCLHLICIIFDYDLLEILCH